MTQQLSLWRPGALSPCPEVRACAPLWAPESAASNAAELERLHSRRPRPERVDCPLCRALVEVDYAPDGARLVAHPCEGAP